MESPIVQYETHDSIAVITMEDGKANALSPTMLDALSEAFDRAEKEAKAVILAGRPGRFSAGFDLKIMATGQEAAMSMIMQGGEFFLRLYEFPKPIVMAVSGHALAGGILLASTGDTRIGMKGDFKIGLNEVTNGMPVPVLGHEFARDRLTASELVPAVMHAKLYDPESAVEAGWLDRVVDPEKLAAEAMAEATKLAALPGYAYAATKRSLRKQTIEYIRANNATNIAELTGRM
tara:strand:- start:65882 stop:66583 length:702 start_codon:yes stop_codon:yes gene_type:complete